MINETTFRSAPNTVNVFIHLRDHFSSKDSIDTPRVVTISVKKTITIKSVI